MGANVQDAKIIYLALSSLSFFEGKGTPFRTDPIKAIRVLGLRDFKS